MSIKVNDRYHHTQGNPLEVILIPLLVIGAIIYGVIAFSSGDPLWLLPGDFNVEPAAIEVYHEGERVVLEPGDPTFEALTAELNEQIDKQVGYYEHGVRPQVLESAKEKSTAVIFVYDEVINIRTQWNLGEPTHIFIPVTGSLSRQNMVFTGVGDRFGHGGLVLEDLTEFYQIVRSFVDEA
ncbi:MAG: hypothetical protein M3220_18205 [Chloroflexota bacterium]|nr:hypothetical protein [Chloroflexota bacterium]